jgi:hypothetical protein
MQELQARKRWLIIWAPPLVIANVLTLLSIMATLASLRNVNDFVLVRPHGLSLVFPHICKSEGCPALCPKCEKRRGVIYSPIERVKKKRRGDGNVHTLGNCGPEVAPSIQGGKSAKLTGAPKVAPRPNVKNERTSPKLLSLTFLNAEG